MRIPRQNRFVLIDCWRNCSSFHVQKSQSPVYFQKILGSQYLLAIDEFWSLQKIRLSVRDTNVEQTHGQFDGQID